MQVNVGNSWDPTETTCAEQIEDTFPLLSFHKFIFLQHSNSHQEKSESENVSRSIVSDSLQPVDCKPIRLLCPWDSPSRNTGVSCHYILHGLFLAQGSNQGLLHCRSVLYYLRHQGSPTPTISWLISTKQMTKSEIWGFFAFSSNNAVPLLAPKPLNQFISHLAPASQQH